MPSQPYHSSLYRFDKPQPSYWEDSMKASETFGEPLQGEDSCDVAIIGGGYTGLSAALHLARDYSIDVRVLDAGEIGWGASGRNAGFCTIGGTKLEVEDQIQRYGVDETRRYFQSQVDAIDLVRQLSLDEDIDYQIQGDREWCVANSPRAYAGLKSEADVLSRVLGIDTQLVSAAEFSECGYDSRHQFGGMAVKPSFGLHPLRYVRGLAAAAGRRGAQLHPASEVLKWESHKGRNNGRHCLKTAAGQLSAQRVIIACNGFMPEHLHATLRGRSLPVQSNIVITRVLSEDELAAHSWHTTDPIISTGHVFNYYRMLADRRLLFGGRGGATGDPKESAQVFSDLEHSVHRYWPEWRGVEFTHRWRGLICMTRELRPAIGRFADDPSVMFGFGYHGNGVNTATWTGRELARWLAEGNNLVEPLPNHLPALVRGLPKRIPLPALRRWYVRGAMAYYRFKDWCR